MRKTTLLSATLAGFIAAPAVAQANELVLYCSVQEEWCRLMSETFQRETGINVL